MDKKKYEFTGEVTKMYGGVHAKTLYQIRALIDIETSVGVVKKGTEGGYIEKGTNLSHSGNCWVYPGAYVFDDAKVENNAVVYQQAKVYGKAHIFQNAKVLGHTTVLGRSTVYGDAVIQDYCWIDGDASISGAACIGGRSVVDGKSDISGDAVVTDNARVSGNARVNGHAMIRDNALVQGDAFVTGEYTDIRDRALISGNAWITSNNDYVYISGVGIEISSMNNITAYTSQPNTIEVICPAISSECKNIDKFIDFVECEMCDCDNKNSFMSAVLHAKNHLSISLAKANEINTPKKVKVTKKKSGKSGNKTTQQTKPIYEYDPIENMVRIVIDRQLLPYGIDNCDYVNDIDFKTFVLPGLCKQYSTWVEESKSETELLIKLYNHYVKEFNESNLDSCEIISKIERLGNAIMEVFGKPKLKPGDITTIKGVKYECVESDE